MRPVRLTMQAFGPYPGREVIDFHGAVEAGLFGIYGQTGSGKSTIFSAMTFALFGEPARAEQDAASLRSDHSDADMVTEVEFVFDIGTTRHVVLRRPDQMRPKQRGGGETRSTHEAFLFDATGIAPEAIGEVGRGRIVAEKKVREVDTAIEMLLGYGKDQFRQIVLLPQGRFETFLSAKTRERLGILRDLFDVSLYRRLAARLKSEADAAERHVREARAVSVARLATAGFESMDALDAGIDAERLGHAAAQTAEQAARDLAKRAQDAFGAAEQVERAFGVAEAAADHLRTVTAMDPQMQALARQVTRAEGARALLDVEARVTDGDAEVRRAGATLRQAVTATEAAQERQTIAARTLDVEVAREVDGEELGRSVDTYERHAMTLRKAHDCATAVAAARREEDQAAEAFVATEHRLARQREALARHAGALKTARLAEVRRQSLATALAASRISCAGAETYEKAALAIESAALEAERLAIVQVGSRAEADRAKRDFDAAERNLSAAQALHLATKLRPDEACPVCGSADHPAPATGQGGHAGLDQAFREARATFDEAEKRAHEIRRQHVAAQSIEGERRSRIEGLDQPPEPASVVLARISQTESALRDLGPATDIDAAETEIERLQDAAQGLAEARERSAARLSIAQRQTAQQTARLDEMLAPVPESLREPAALTAALEQAKAALEALRRARREAEMAATASREAALVARNEAEAAGRTVAHSRERLAGARDAFERRLTGAGLTEPEFRDLKPAIATLAEDRETLDRHRRVRDIAVERARSAAAAIDGVARPDMASLGAARLVADTEATERMRQVASAIERCTALVRLKDSLTDARKALDEAEASSGPLRRLAAEINGDNDQKLDLETFAIGAMFDLVLEAANLRLEPMTSGRYRLGRDPAGSGRGKQGLEIEVFDIFTGKSRPTATLSGGETFIAALALALGLADVVESASGKVRLDTIFIDEGFGSLDTENGSGTLDLVIGVLDRLVTEHRAVGLISHVPLVQERIPNGFYVHKGLAGSTIETRDAL